jgi:DNA-binding CsgD family transcriptional regulator
MSPVALWRSWTTPSTEGELARRRESVLLNVLAILFVLSLVVNAIELASPALGTSLADLLSVYPFVLAAAVAFYGLLRLARGGRHRAAAIALLVLLGLLVLYLLVAAGVANPMTSLMVTLTVLLAAMLLGARASAIVVAGAAVALIASATLESTGTLRPLSPIGEKSHVRPVDGIGMALVLATIAWICWLYTRDALTSVDEALTHGSLNSPLRQLRTKTLTWREIEVVQLVAEGLSNDQIAKRLFVSPRTVQSHVANAMRKTSCANRTELGVLALREGLVPLFEPPEPTLQAGPAEPAR